MVLKPAWAVFSFNSFAAAMLALAVGFSLDLPRPYWAMLTVYITAQPLTGALRSKALYRVLGTGLGAAVAVVLTPLLVDAPPLLCAAMALWAGLCLYVSLLDRTPRAYVFALAGYTAAIIGFPSVNAPEAVFQTALARVEEITLGIACATLVHTVVFPRDVGGALRARAAVFLADAERWICLGLTGTAGEAEGRQRRRIAADVTELHLLSTHLPFDTAHLRPRREAVRALQDRLAVLLPLLSGVEDRLGVLRAAGALPPELAALVQEAGRWARRGDAPPEAARALQARCEALAPPLERPEWLQMVQASAAARLAQLVEALQDCRDLAAALGRPEAEPPPRLAGPARRPLHRDHGVALLSAAALALAVLGCCAFWILAAWPDGATAAMMAAVYASMFAAQDDPSPALTSFLGWTVASVPIAAVYLFAVLPQIDSFVPLALALAPAFLALGYLQANPRHTGKALPVILGVAGALSLQETFSASVTGFANGMAAQMVGIGAALAAAQLIRSLSADWVAGRLLRHGRRDLARLAGARTPPAREAWASAMLDRIGLLAPRLAQAEGGDDVAEDALKDLRAGQNIIDLKLARAALPRAPAADAALARLAALYAEEAAGRAVAPSPELLGQIDAAAQEFAAAPGAAERRQGLVALTGLRRALFPRARGLSPEGAA